MATVWVILAGAAVPAAAQDVSAPGRFALNLGIGTVRSTSVIASGASMLGTAGFDFRVSDAWQVRLEAGKRLPSRSMWQTHTRMPGGPQTTTEGRENSHVDAAALLRRSWRSGRFEAGALAGVDLHFLTLREKTWTYPRPDESDDFTTSEHVKRRTRGAFDVGLDAGVAGPVTFLLYAIVGVRSPAEAERGRQVRVGGIVQFRF